jgi:uncharacterized protein (TIGR00255 family)
MTAAPLIGAPKFEAGATTKSSIKSMTGYAQARTEYNGLLLRVTLRSVNHRFLDLRLRLPEGLEMFESALRQQVRDRLRRGHVEVTIYVESQQATAVQIHHDVAAAYLHAAEGLRREFDLSQEPDLIALMRLPGVVAAPGTANVIPQSGAIQDDEATERLGRQLADCLSQGLIRLEEMRQAEGLSLAAEMRSLLASIVDRSSRLEPLVQRSLPVYAQRLKNKIEELLGSSLDPARLAQEAALLAERADISEELARLRSHTTQFSELLDGAGELGKKLDFLLQEMNREANTLLSKTPGLGEEALAIADLGLEIKGDIEKLREQIQNVE